MKKRKIIVLMGGPSSEHEVSLNTGKEIIKHLDRKKYAVGSVVVPKSGRWFLPKFRLYPNEKVELLGLAPISLVTIAKRGEILIVISFLLVISSTRGCVNFSFFT